MGDLQKKYPKPQGKMVKILVENNIRGVTNLREDAVLPTSINGYGYDIPMGKAVEVPEEVALLLESCKSRTKVPDMEQSQRNPRRQAEFGTPPMTWEYHNDYRVHRL